MTEEEQPPVIRLFSPEDCPSLFLQVVHNSAPDQAVCRDVGPSGIRDFAQAGDRDVHQLIIFIGMDFVEVDLAGPESVLCLRR